MKSEETEKIISIEINPHFENDNIRYSATIIALTDKGRLFKRPVDNGEWKEITPNLLERK